MSDRLVIVDANYPDAEVERAAASELGIEVLRQLVSATEEIPGAVGESAGLLVQFMVVDDETMAACPGLRVIGRYGVGVDNVDVEAASRRGIAVVNVPDYSVEEVASHALAMLLAIWRMLPSADRLVRAGKWPQWESLAPIGPLGEATLGLVGFGRIGRELARQARPVFGSIVAADPMAASQEDIELVELDVLLARSDAVSLHAPLTPATERLMDASRLGMMGPGSVLVNVSRGRLIDVPALLSALNDGTLRAAALDVLPTEPPAPDDPLLTNTRVLLSNHVAWYSTRSTERLRRSLAERCAQVLVGQRPSSVVNANAISLGKTSA